MAVQKKPQVKVVSSLNRILRDQLEFEGSDKASLYSAKSEIESFQIILVNNNAEALRDVNLFAGNWKYLSGDDHRGMPELIMYREHYVPIKILSVRSTAPKGMYPDALIPFVDPYTGKPIEKATYLARNQTVEPWKTQAYWVDINVANSVKAGIYTNVVNVISENKWIAQIPVELTVWDFELPKRHNLKTFFYGMHDVSSYHNVNKESMAYKVIANRYENYLSDSGLTLEFPWRPAPVTYSNGRVIFKEPYINRLKSFIIRMKPCVFRIKSSFRNDPVARARYLSCWGVFLRANKWIPTAIIYFDEPSKIEQYETIISYGKTIKQYAPNIKLLVTEQIKPQKPEFPSMEGIIDIWVPLWGLANTEDIKRRQKAGDEVWSYVALAQSTEVPTWLLDYPILNYRIPAWFSYSLDLKGILYWSTMSWADKDINPWVNPATHTKTSKVWNGAGSLVYPGSPCGIAGPVASMRLKVFRDSLEDYDYCCLLTELIGSSQVRQITINVAKDFKRYSKEPTAYLQARRKIAEQILNARTIKPKAE